MSCSLDQAAFDRQLGRFASIGEQTLWTRRYASELTAVLDPALDDELLHEALTVERGCCPFLAVFWDEDQRELTIVAREQHQPVLDRIAAAIDAA